MRFGGRSSAKNCFATNRSFNREKTFLAGAQAVIEAMLQSPNFIFWVEQSPNPKWKPYATAARLAYFIWNTTPDDALLESAAKGELNTADGVEKTVRKMLESPKARDGVDEFVAQWLRFDRVLASARERRVYPLFNQELARAMTEESKRFINDLIWNDRNFMEAFTANYSFINSDLAAVYKVPPPAQDFARVEFPSEAGRSGILGQASFLTLTSKPDDTAPTGRGLFVREQFLCQQVPPPPPDVDTNLPPVDEAKPVTNRERLAAHTTNQMCVRCHSLIDPVGFGFEKFDAIGMRREKHKLCSSPPGAAWRPGAQSRRKSSLKSTRKALSPDSRTPASRRPGSWENCWRELHSVTNVLSNKSSGLWPDVLTRRLTVRCFGRHWKLFGSPGSVSKS